MSDLCSAQFFDSTEQTIAGVVDDDVDLPEISERFAHNLLNLGRVCHVQMGQPQKLAVFFFKIVHCIHLANCPRDTIAACEKLLRHETAEAAVHAGDEPSSLLCHFSCLSNNAKWIFP